MQIQLNMKATNSDLCHFVTWTPKTTKIATVRRNDSFIDELLEAVYQHYWILTAPPTTLHPKLREIERKAKEHSEKVKMTLKKQSLNSSSTIPHLSQFSPENIEIQAAKEKHCKLQSMHDKPHKRVLDCSKCRRPLVICNVDQVFREKGCCCQEIPF